MYFDGLSIVMIMLAAIALAFMLAAPLLALPFPGSSSIHYICSRNFSGLTVPDILAVNRLLN